MNSTTSSSARAQLLQTLREPSNFNDWLVGTHYSGDYLPHLERIARLEHAALQASTTPTTATARHSIGRGATRHDTSMGDGQENADAIRLAETGTTVAVGVPEASPEADGDTAGQLTRTPSDSVRAVEREGRHGTVRPPRQATLKKTTQAPADLSAIRGTATLGSQGLNAAEVRQQLQISYERMKQVDGFGQTFPALLTPMRRPVFHYYREDEWAQVTHRHGPAPRCEATLRRPQDAATGSSTGCQSRGVAHTMPNPPRITALHGSRRRAPEPPSGPPAFHATLTTRMCRTL